MPWTRAAALTDEHRARLIATGVDNEVLASTALRLVSGPPGMVNGVADALEDEGVPEEQVIRSRFSGY